MTMMMRHELTFTDLKKEETLLLTVLYALVFLARESKKKVRRSRPHSGEKR